MELVFVKALSSMLLPPTGLIVLGLLGLGLSLGWRKLGFWLISISLFSLLLCSMPVVSALLVNTLQNDAPIEAAKLKQIGRASCRERV